MAVEFQSISLYLQRNTLRSIIYIFLRLIILSIFIIIVLSSCGNSDKELSEYNSKNLGIEEILNVQINYTLGGKAKAKLSSPLMLRVQEVNPYVEFTKKMHVDFFNEIGAVDSRLDARYGKYFELESKVFLKDSVKVVNVLGDTLYCNELWWDRNKKGCEFYTDKPVRIRRKMQIIDGVGMDASQDFKAWHIINPVGVISIPNSQFSSN